MSNVDGDFTLRMRGGEPNGVHKVLWKYKYIFIPLWFSGQGTGVGEMIGCKGGRGIEGIPKIREIEMTVDGKQATSLMELHASSKGTWRNLEGTSASLREP